MDTTSHLGADLHRARYTIDADATHMTVEELVCRVQARHRMFIAAIRTARAEATDEEPSAHPDRAAFGPRRTQHRPPNWDAIMELAGRLKGENVRWKEIRERVEAAHGYRFDSDEALRKSFERWMKGRKDLMPPLRGQT